MARIQLRLDRLASELVQFWLRHGIDYQYGGFHGTLDRAGRAVEPSHKNLITQARYLWAFSAWYERRESTTFIAAVAHGTYRFISEHLWDPNEGEFRLEATREGRLRSSAKPLCAQAAAIHALATYARVFRHDAAKALALRCFDTVELRAYDRAHGGYDRSGELIWALPAGSKDVSTHLGWLEALMALYELCSESRVRQRLTDLVTLIAERFKCAPDYLHQQFSAEWKPVGDGFRSFGHELQAAWSLVEASRTLGMRQLSAFESALALGRAAAEYGFDKEQGGFHHVGSPAGEPLGREKLAWVQGEALPALWWLHRLGGGDVQMLRLARTLDWIERQQRDSEHGEWHWGVSPEGGVLERSDAKSAGLRATHHVLRGLLYTSDWIRDHLNAASAPALPAETQERAPD